MFTIGEFSRITQLSIKAIRLYHEEGLLIPEHIDEDSGYRYYATDSIQRGTAIRTLRDLGFTIVEIKEILSVCKSEKELTSHIEKKMIEVEKTMAMLGKRKTLLKDLLHNMRISEKPYSDEIRKENIPNMLVCSTRYIGRYSDAGTYLTILYRKCGTFISGPAMSLYHEMEYKENDADIEICIPVKKRFKAEGIICRSLEGGSAQTFMHQGPYEMLGKSYEKFFTFLNKNNIKIATPLREIYLKGPGIIFKGDPSKYRTKIVGLV